MRLSSEEQHERDPEQYHSQNKTVSHYKHLQVKEVPGVSNKKTTEE